MSELHLQLSGLVIDPGPPPEARPSAEGILDARLHQWDRLLPDSAGGMSNLGNLTLVQKRYDSRESQPMSFDAFLSEVQSRTGVPLSIVRANLQPVWKSTVLDPVLDRKVSREERRVLVAAFLVRIGKHFT